MRSYSLPDYPDSTATVCDAIVAALSGSPLGEASPGMGVVESFGIGGMTLADETEQEAAMLWGAHKEDLSSLVKCFMSIAAKEARKRRADDELPEKALPVREERIFRFELDRSLVDDLLSADQQLAAVERAAKEYLEEHRTAVRQCAWALKGKQSAYHRLVCSLGT
jgi:hypothetical protein